MRLRAFLAMGLLAASAQAGAKAPMHKCIGPDGRITYQSTPCPPSGSASSPSDAPAPFCAMTANEYDAAVRREQPFLARYKTDLRHRAAHRAELEPVVGGLKPMLARLNVLLDEHRRLAQERLFYDGKPLPPKLLAAIAANEGQLAGLAEAFRRAQESIEAIAARRRCETETYGPLWHGAAPGASACKRPPCLPE